MSQSAHVKRQSLNLFHLTYRGHPALTRRGLYLAFCTRKSMPNTKRVRWWNTDWISLEFKVHLQGNIKLMYEDFVRVKRCYILHFCSIFRNRKLGATEVSSSLFHGKPRVANPAFGEFLNYTLTHLPVIFKVILNIFISCAWYRLALSSAVW